jgi:rhodanese-related sulfurtransferase
VRTAAEFRGVHVIGATNLPLHRLTSERLQAALGERSNGTVYFICKAGTRSEAACEKALAFGVSNVVNVAGGTDDCVTSGLPVESGRKAISLERQVRMAAGAMILLGVVMAVVHHPYWAGLSGFVGAGLLFSGITNTCLMGDLLAKMPWNQG